VKRLRTRGSLLVPRERCQPGTDFIGPFFFLRSIPSVWLHGLSGFMTWQPHTKLSVCSATTLLLHNAFVFKAIFSNCRCSNLAPSLARKELSVIMLRVGASPSASFVGETKDTSSMLSNQRIPSASLTGASASDGPRTSRRVIFPSLYESPRSTTPPTSLPRSLLSLIPESPHSILDPLGQEEYLSMKSSIHHLIASPPLFAPPLPCKQVVTTRNRLAIYLPFIGTTQEQPVKIEVPTKICLDPPQLRHERAGKVALRSAVKPGSVCKTLQLHQDTSRLVEESFIQTPCDSFSTEGATKITKPLCSILRSRSSVESDIPSLASSDESHDDGEDLGDFHSAHHRRYQSDPTLSRSGSISFSPHVLVREFERSEIERKSIWYTPRELGAFKLQAMHRIMLYDNNGTASQARAHFSHAALAADSADHFGNTMSPDSKRFRDAVVENEMRTILVVDPHDICLQLFSKSLKMVLPHACIVTASSSEEALRHVAAGKSFDIVIVEERLGLFHRQSNDGESSNNNQLSSGASLIRRLVEADGGRRRKALLVGVSARIQNDGGRLQAAGADFCWSKPPPQLDRRLLDEMLEVLLIKRGYTAAAKELFGK
jgi:CheY-like chemotaxis protein